MNKFEIIYSVELLGNIEFFYTKFSLNECNNM